MFRIKELCQERGITLETLSKQLGYAYYQTLHNAMKGNPTMETLEKIAAALGVQIVDLFERPRTALFNCPKCGCRLSVGTA